MIIAARVQAQLESVFAPHKPTYSRVIQPWCSSESVRRKQLMSALDFSVTNTHASIAKFSLVFVRPRSSFFPYLFLLELRVPAYQHCSADALTDDCTNRLAASNNQLIVTCLAILLSAFSSASRLTLLLPFLPMIALCLHETITNR